MKEQKAVVTRLIMCIILLLCSVHITRGSFFYFPPHKSKVEGQHESHILTPAQSGKLTLWHSESNNSNNKKKIKQPKTVKDTSSGCK